MTLTYDYSYSKLVSELHEYEREIGRFAEFCIFSFSKVQYELKDNDDRLTHRLRVRYAMESYKEGSVQSLSTLCKQHY